MPIQTLRWRDFTGGLWIKGPRENNPPGSLRRAKGVYPLRTGSIRSRSGIHQFAALNAHSLFKAYATRIAGVGINIMRDVAGTFTTITTGAGGGQNGNPLTFVNAPPTTGKSDYVFVAGGGALKKINPALDTLTFWGIAPPSGTAPDAALGSRSSVEIDDFDTAANWTCTDVTDDDGVTVNATKTQVTAKKVEGTGSVRFRVPRDAVTRLDRTIALNLNEFSPVIPSGDEDYIELFIAFNKPKHVRSVNISFLVGSTVPATTDDFDNYSDNYSREVLIETVRKKKRRRLVGTGDFIRNKDTVEELTQNRVKQIDFSMAEFVSEDKIGVTRRVWARITLPKASFVQNGNAGTSGKTWANVQGVRISVETTNQGRSRVWLDFMRMIGGVGMQGDYQYMFTFFNNDTGTRSDPFPMTTDSVTGASVFAPVLIRDVERQPVVIGGSSALPTVTDPQVTHLEIWRTVGNGTQFFLSNRIAHTSIAPFGVYTDRVADYPGMFSGGGGTLFLQPEEMPDDNARPLDTVIFAVGSVFGRMFLITTLDNRVYYSGIGRMETVSNFVEVGSTDEHVQQLVFWNETLFAFTRSGVYRCITTDEPFIFTKILGVPGTRFPRTVKATDAMIIYQANDGIRSFDGLQSELIADDALAPIFRGGASDGISAFSGVTSEYGRGEYYVSDTNTTLAYSENGGWRNIGLPCRAIFWENDTRVLLAAVTSGTTRICSLEGDASGEVSGLVAQSTTDFGGVRLASDFEIETGGELGGVTGVWGIAQRIYIEGQVEAQDLEVSLVLDNLVDLIDTVTLPVGVKRMMEVAVHRAGFITGVRIAVPTGEVGGISTRIEISEIKVDVYVPDSRG